MIGRMYRAVVIAFLLSGALCAPGQKSPQHRFGIEGSRFTLDGAPFQIISGEMHYARIPREYWRARLKMARAMGLNTISTYVFWDLHEARPGVYDFSGQLDVAEFIREAQQEGLKVILRPGPYVCSEWDLGGLPAWLLSDPTIVLRSRDPKFMKPAQRWLERLGKELAPLQVGNGGPIIAVQVENEYGSFDNDHEYMRQIFDAIRAAGFTESQLYTADGPEQLPSGTLPGVPAVVNLGPGDAKAGLETLAKFRPGAPLMIGEWWAGWFDHWGRKHHVTNGDDEARELDWILSNGYSVSVYMFHGGTTPGFMNGANNDANGYWPDTSSYDYSAALDESGRPTKKYFRFRDVIAKRTGQHLPDVPAVAPAMTVDRFELDRVAPLFANLPKPIASDHILPMEEVGQSYGLILYSTDIPGKVAGDLVIREVRDFARVFLNGVPAGTLDRRLKQDRLRIVTTAAKTRLDILVENDGRINFTKALRGERKGITESVTLNGKELLGWKIYPLPMHHPASLPYGAAPQKGPAFYRGTFHLETTADTFLDFSSWSKGTVWVNGHQLGRFWNIGPQQTLYVPAVWLKKGANEIIVFDWDPPKDAIVSGLDHPVLDQLREPTPGN